MRAFLMLNDWLIWTWHLPTLERAVKPLLEYPMKTFFSPRSSPPGTFRQKSHSCFRGLLSAGLVERHVTTVRHTDITKIWGFNEGWNRLYRCFLPSSLAPSSFTSALLFRFPTSDFTSKQVWFVFLKPCSPPRTACLKNWGIRYRESLISIFTK